MNEEQEQDALAKLRVRITDAFAASLAAGDLPGGMMVGNWVFAGNVVQESGDVAPLMVCSDTGGLDAVLGLLWLAQLNWEEAAREWLNQD